MEAGRGLVEPGSNGQVLVPEGLFAQPLLVVMQHGGRQVVLMDPDHGNTTALTATTGGRRLNSPNDGAFRPGTRQLYFTDPPCKFI